MQVGEPALRHNSEEPLALFARLFSTALDSVVKEMLIHEHSQSSNPYLRSFHNDHTVAPFIQTKDRPGSLLIFTLAKLLIPSEINCQIRWLL